MSDNFKVGDLFTFTKQLRWDDGTPIDLTDATSVEFVMQLDDGVTTVRGECVVVDATKGIVSYAFKNGETSVAGMYRYEYEIHSVPLGDEASRVYTVPSSGRYWIHIEDDAA